MFEPVRAVKKGSDSLHQEVRTQLRRTRAVGTRRARSLARRNASELLRFGRIRLRHRQGEDEPTLRFTVTPSRRAVASFVVQCGYRGVLHEACTIACRRAGKATRDH